MSSRNTAGWSRLAAEVKTRRDWLQLSHHGVARRGGPSHETTRTIENQARTGFRSSTLTRLDRGLGWKQGTAASIVEGTAGDDREAWNMTGPSGSVAPPRPLPDPEGMSPLTMSLDHATDRELAAEMVARFVRRPGNARLLTELMGVLATVPEEDESTEASTAS